MTLPQQALLDTDILSAIMRRNPQGTERARLYLEQHRHFTFSVITRYEVLRGLLAKEAVNNLQRLISYVPKVEFCRSLTPQLSKLRPYMLIYTTRRIDQRC